MNVRRWFGALLLIGCLVLMGVTAQGQQKDQGKDSKGKDQTQSKDNKGGTPAKDNTPAKGNTPPKDNTAKAPAETGGGDKLVLKAFEPGGKTFYQEMTTKTKQVMKVMTMEVTQDQNQTFYISWTPKEKKGNDLVVEQKIIGVKMDIDIGGNKISYDSTAAAQPANPLTDFFKALQGATFTVTVNGDPNSEKYMQVTSVEGRDKFIEKLASTNQQLKPLLETILSNEALKSMAEPAFGVIPPKGMVPASKTWERKSDLNMGPIGTYDTKYKYTFKEKKGNLAEIDFTTDLTYIAPMDSKNNTLPFKITEAHLTSKDGKGIAHFDLEKGRVNDSKMDLKLEGKLKIEVGGMTTEVELNQTQTAELKTSDTDPTKK